MSETTWLGYLLRAAISMALLFLGAGLAQRMCHGPKSWLMATVASGSLFGYLALGVAPKPEEAGLLYSVQWGIAGITLYCLARATGWIGPSHSATREEEKP